MVKNEEIQGPIDSSLEVVLREMKMKDRLEVTISLDDPFHFSFELLSLYLSFKGIKDYTPIQFFNLVVDLHLSRREIIDLAEESYVRDMRIVRENYW